MSRSRLAGLPTLNWEIGNQIDGGPATNIEITSNGKTHSRGEQSELMEAERELVDALIDGVESLVADDLWETMNQLQAEQEMNAD